LGVDVRRRSTELDRPFHGRDEALAVVLERACAADLVPEASLLDRIGLQTDGPMEEREAFVYLVAADRQLGRARGPLARLHAQLLGFGFVTRPGEVDVLGTDRLGVVVREESGVLVAALTAPLEPAREGGVKLRTSRLGQARVRDLARQRVLDRVLAL